MEQLKKETTDIFQSENNYFKWIVYKNSGADGFVQEDILSDSFISMMKAIDNNTFIDGGNLKNYIISIVRNTSIAWYRKKIKSKEVYALKTSDDGNEYFLWDLMGLEEKSREDDIENDDTDFETKLILNDCFSYLSEIQSIVLKMRYYENKKIKEIADDLNIPMTRIKGCIEGGLKKIREIYYEKTH